MLQLRVKHMRSAVGFHALEPVRIAHLHGIYLHAHMEECSMVYGKPKSRNVGEANAKVILWGAYIISLIRPSFGLL